jgi:hypothetical protein
MSIELLNKEHLSTFKNSIDNTKKRIRIVSPFIGFETSKQLANSLKDNQVKCTIITRFYREDFLNHASCLEGLRILLEAGVKVITLKSLHSKLYIFDDELAILGSANFTMGGFQFNHELSLIIEDEEEFINQLSKYYDDLLDKIESSGDWQLDLKKVEEEIRFVDELSKNRKDRNIKYKNIYQFGAAITDKTEIRESDDIEKIIRENINSGFKNGVWLKFVGTGDDRYVPTEKYSPERLNRNGKNVTSFPRNPRSIEDMDFIYLSALSWDKNGVATPMIVARANTLGFKVENVATEEDCKQYKWMSEYPYYVEIYDIEILNTEISNCISLDRLIRELGCDLYPSTQRKQLSVAELKSRHHQKSHLRLQLRQNNILISYLMILEKNMV